MTSEDMTRQEKIEYVAEYSNHTVRQITTIVNRNEAMLDQLVHITDGQLKQSVEEEASLF